MTRTDQRAAGVLALLTSVPLVASLVTMGAGPASRHPHGIVTWVGSNGLQLRISALAWTVAMLGIVLVAIRLRDALISSFASRWWAGVLIVQGATVFAAVSVVSAAATWAVAELGGASSPDAATVTALWTLHCALLTFACWGLTVPIWVIGRALLSHSLLGQIATVLGVGVMVALLIPAIQLIALYVFAGWLALVGTALLVHGRRSRREALSPSRAAGPFGG